jgi:Tfp pilus assembly protein PilE
MTKALVNIMVVCLIFSILSVVMTSGNDDIAKAKAEAKAAAAEAEAAIAKAKAAAEAAAAAEAEELDTSLPSFSTSAALSFDDDFIAPDISAGKAPVNCVIGDWEDFGNCNQTTGEIQQRRKITPAMYGGGCTVTTDANGYDNSGSRACDRYCTLDANWIPEYPTCPTACGQGDSTIVQRRGQTVKYVPPGQGNTCYDDVNSSQRKNVIECPNIPCVIGFEHNFTGAEEIMRQSGNQHTIPNDSMTSIRVPPGNWVQLFEHHDYGGACRDFPNIGEWRDYVLDGFNDTVTSYKVGRGPTQYCPGSPPPSGAPHASDSGTGFGSDRRLKDDIKKIGEYEDLNVYIWRWNEVAMTTYGYMGMQVGFMSDELDREYIDVDVYGYDFIKNGTKISEALENVRKLFPAT